MRPRNRSFFIRQERLMGFEAGGGGGGEIKKILQKWGEKKKKKGV